MVPLREKAPAYLFGRRQMYATVAVTAMFAAFVMLLFMPFSHNPWLTMTLAMSMGYVVLFFVICFLFLCISRYILYRFRGKVAMYGYCLWMIAEVLVISIFYSIATLYASSRGMIPSNLGFGVLLFKSIAYCVLALLVPCAFCAMYFEIEDKDNIIRMTDFGAAVSDETAAPVQDRKITLFDNNGNLKLSVNESNLFYIESDDNYVKVWYNDTSDNLRQYMLRCRLKTIEESFRDSSLVRCHRKYIANMMHVEKIAKVKDGYMIKMDNPALPDLVVTKTYEENVLKRFNER